MIEIHTYNPQEFRQPKKRRFPRVDPIVVGSMVTGLVCMYGVSQVLGKTGPELTAQAIGGPSPEQRQELPVAAAEEPKSETEAIRRLRTKQAVLNRRQEILRYQLRQLEAQRQQVLEGTQSYEQLRRSRKALVMLLRDQEDTDAQLVDYLRQVWEADGKAHVATMGMESVERIVMSWPVEPTAGISAEFADAAYEDIFHMPHEAIDIPVVQGTPVRSAASGTVINVADNGLGYSYIIVRHRGFATLYGHMSGFKAQKGDSVAEGQIIGLSGGIPGTKGAGPMTTGAHLHFELIRDGQKIDPMPYLPYSSQVEVYHDWKKR